MGILGLTLDHDAIDVWMVDLDEDGPEVPLTPQERSRAAMALDPGERRRRLRTRWALRRILAAYADTPAAELAITADPGGKPRLGGGPDFNLSHSGSIMLLAVSAAGPVGVDVERTDRLKEDWDAVSQRVFSEAERRQLSRLPEPERARAALRGWVRKEAYSKARGAGFAYGFTAFTVDLADGAGASGLVEDTKDAGAPRAWTMRDLLVPTGFTACLVHGSRGATLRERSYKDALP